MSNSSIIQTLQGWLAIWNSVYILSGACAILTAVALFWFKSRFRPRFLKRKILAWTANLSVFAVVVSGLASIATIVLGDRLAAAKDKEAEKRIAEAKLATAVAHKEAKQAHSVAENARLEITRLNVQLATLQSQYQESSVTLAGTRTELLDLKTPPSS